MNAHNPPAKSIAAAEEVLRGRSALPANPAEWGRSFGFAPGVAERLVRAEERRRRA